jgi:hypothetical protein
MLHKFIITFNSCAYIDPECVKSFNGAAQEKAFGFRSSGLLALKKVNYEKSSWRTRLSLFFFNVFLPFCLKSVTPMLIYSTVGQTHYPCIMGNKAGIAQQCLYILVRYFAFRNQSLSGGPSFQAIYRKLHVRRRRLVIESGRTGSDKSIFYGRNL